MHGWARSIADKVCRVTILLQDSSEVVNFLLKVALCANGLSGSVVEASHHSSFHVGRMIGLEVKIPVRDTSGLDEGQEREKETTGGDTLCGWDE